MDLSVGEKSTRRTTSVTMPCRLGLHARTATRFILFAKQFRSEIRVRKGGLVVDGKSILGLLLLGATWKSRLQIEAEGEDAEKAIQAIESYFVVAENCDDEISRKSEINNQL